MKIRDPRRTAMSSTDAHDHELMAAAQADVSVLITSERKDVRLGLARSIHAQSARRSVPLVEFDCGLWSAPEGGRRLDIGLDREQFTDLRNRFREASDSTLFLDRIETMSEPLQAELFCLLEGTTRHSDVPSLNGICRPRLITGASRSLLAAIAAGTFHEGLFYRLNLIHLDFTNRPSLEGVIMKIRDLMSTPPQTCRPDTDLGAIARMMWDHDCGFVPVIDASGRVVGVITDRDICIATATRHLLPEKISAEQAMNGPVHACMADDGVNDALAAMKEFKVRRLPVVNASGQLQGVISMNDIALVSDQKRKPTPRDVVSTMAAICAHRPAATITT